MTVSYFTRDGVDYMRTDPNGSGGIALRDFGGGQKDNAFRAGFQLRGETNPYYPDGMTGAGLSAGGPVIKTVRQATQKKPRRNSAIKTTKKNSDGTPVWMETEKGQVYMTRVLEIVEEKEAEKQRRNNPFSDDNTLPGEVEPESDGFDFIGALEGLLQNSNDVIQDNYYAPSEGFISPPGSEVVAETGAIDSKVLMAAGVAIVGYFLL
jgi:hypothetical protein